MLSFVKIVHWITYTIEHRKPFSIQDIEAQYFNERFLNLIFSAFGIDAEQKNNLNTVNLLIILKSLLDS